MSLTRRLKGFCSPLWVLMISTEPPQVVMAMAALMISSMSSTWAASSMIARSPGRPRDRRFRGSEVSASIFFPLGNDRLNLWTARPLSSLSTSWPMCSARPCSFSAQSAQSPTKPSVMSLLKDM